MPLPIAARIQKNRVQDDQDVPVFVQRRACICNLASKESGAAVAEANEKVPVYSRLSGTEYGTFM